MQPPWRPRYCPMKSLFGSPLSPLPEKAYDRGEWQKQAAKFNGKYKTTYNCSFHSLIALAATREHASTISTILVLVSSVTSCNIVRNIVHCGIMFEALTSSRGLNFATCQKLRSNSGTLKTFEEHSNLKTVSDLKCLELDKTVTRPKVTSASGKLICL